MNLKIKAVTKALESSIKKINKSNDISDYEAGLINGMELAKALLNDTKPNFIVISQEDIKFEHVSTTKIN